MIELIIHYGLIILFGFCVVLMYRVLQFWRQNRLLQMRQTCHVLHHTAEIEKEIYGSVVSTSILRHLEEEQGTCDVEREKRIAAQLSTLAASPQPTLPDPGRTLAQGMCIKHDWSGIRQIMGNAYSQIETFCTKCGAVKKSCTHSWVDTTTLSDPETREICARCGAERPDGNNPWD